MVQKQESKVLRPARAEPAWTSSKQPAEKFSFLDRCNPLFSGTLRFCFVSFVSQPGLKDIKLVPGVKVLYKNVKITKQKGFGRFNLLAYKKRNYRHYKANESWFIITNLDDPLEVIRLCDVLVA